MFEKISQSKVPLWSVVTAVLLLAVVSAWGPRLIDREYDFSFTPEDAAAKYGLRFGAWPSLANADFFGRVRADLLSKQASFIEADLSAMKLAVYKDGARVLEVPILTKGRKGSWWETPAGVYAVRAKEKKHFSSIGRVNMPWSMQFQGNFFIHGWPTYEDGQTVASSYSGGCVRLGTADAEAVYRLSSVGMPVLVYESDFTTDDFTYREKIPILSARQYLAADLKNNFVFMEKGREEAVAIASITKLMTAVVATEHVNLDKLIEVPEEAIVKTSKPRLRAGEEVSAYGLLFPLLMESSNEAAETLARTYGRSRFIAVMNENARSLGMAHTAFADPAGAEAANVATAEDLFNLAKYLVLNRSFILDITAGRVTRSAYGTTPFAALENYNGFAGEENFLGGKTGLTTAASSTMIAVFNLRLLESMRPVAIIVLGSEDAEKDVRAIRAYIRERYQ